MQIYFCGSIRGGRDDVETYADLITHIERYGNVLTKHVGTTDPYPVKLTDRGIHERDMNFIERADVFITEVSTPSLGIGYELSKAEDRGKKVLCLYRNGSPKRLSPLISGNQNFEVKNYDDLDEAKKYIDEFISSLNTDD